MDNNKLDMNIFLGQENNESNLIIQKPFFDAVDDFNDEYELFKTVSSISKKYYDQSILESQQSSNRRLFENEILRKFESQESLDEILG